MGECLFLSILLAICAIAFFLTFGFKVSILDTSGGAALFPRIIILFLAVVCIIRIIQILREKEKHPFVFWELFKGYRLFFLAMMACYIFLLKPVGYILTTSIFMLVTVNVFYRETTGNMGSIKSIVIRNVLSIVFVAVLYVFFARVVHIMLPAGLLKF